MIGRVMANKPVRPEMVDKLMKQYKKGTKAKRITKKKTAQERKVGTTSGSTQLNWAVAQSTDGPPQQNTLVQVDRHLNLVNRRLYRQHKVYTCKVELSNPNEDQQPIGVYVLRNTWAVRKAIAEAKRVYDEAVKEERAVVGNARWHDFRISAFDAWGNANFALPFNVNGPAQEYRPVSEGPLGEYDYSIIATTDATGAEQLKPFKLQDSSTTTAFSIWEEFQNMGPRTSATPVSASLGGYDRARGTDFEDSNVNRLLDAGNQAPYNPENLGLDTPWVKVGEIGRLATGGMITSTGYFEAPLGLIVLEGYQLFGSSGAPLPLRTQIVEVCVKDGDYKGVAAHDI